ncbi:hypothetical protein [Brevundimonas sp. DWR2-3-1b1]|uniref:hypothetical protein n=1 Tax=unclassified Brevundimonas TaxID=2622653 RepID=UPI003CED205E
MRTAIAAAMAVALTAGSAHAGFVTNRVQWNALGDRKGDYVMGIIDQMSLIDPTSPYGRANTEGVLACLKDLDLNNQSIVQIIDEGYARDASTWGDIPVIVLNREFTTICRSHMDAKRIEAGLNPLPPARP